jgi:hypothetical protein
MLLKTREYFKVTILLEEMDGKLSLFTSPVELIQFPSEGDETNGDWKTDL